MLVLYVLLFVQVGASWEPAMNLYRYTESPFEISVRGVSRFISTNYVFGSRDGSGCEISVERQRRATGATIEFCFCCSLVTVLYLFYLINPIALIV